MSLAFIEQAPAGLPREAEQELATRIQAEHDPKAVQELVMANVRWAAKLTHQLMARYHIPAQREDDMLQTSLLAMTKAAWAFKPGGARFTTYSTTPIQRHIIDVLSAGPFYIPAYMRHAVHVYCVVRNEAGLHTFEQVEAAGLMPRIFEVANKTTKSLSLKTFPALLRRAVHLSEAQIGQLEKEEEFGSRKKTPDGEH